MSKDKVAEFVSECAQLKQRDSAKSIEVGPTIWLLGSPAPASDGEVTPNQRSQRTAIALRARPAAEL
jgi:hypothetical protein